MTQRPADTHYEAMCRVTRTKQALDHAQARLEEAEAEWLAACRELDRLDGVELPSFQDVRGILKR